MTPDFSNTAIAFRSRTNFELWRNYLLFRLVEHPRWVRFFESLVTFALKIRLPIQWLIKRTVFAVFCGGETVHESKRVIHRLAQAGVGTILDYAAEGVSDEKQFDQTAREILSTVQFAKNNPAIPFCVFKATGLTRFQLLEKLQSGAQLTTEESAEWQRAEARMRRICEAAFESHVRILIDAEESWIQAPVDAFATAMMRKYNQKEAIVFNTLQMYRRDRLAFLERSFTESRGENYTLGIKLVRGAYMEKERLRTQKLGLPDVIQATKEDTDRAYDQALDFCLDRLGAIEICIGTHNEASTLRAVKKMEDRGFSAGDTRVFYAQLLGMSDHLTFNLAAAGYLAAKYVPYGQVRTLMPYLFRRAAENTSVQGQSARELELVRRELARRRSNAPHP